MKDEIDSIEETCSLLSSVHCTQENVVITPMHIAVTTSERLSPVIGKTSLVTVVARSNMVSQFLGGLVVAYYWPPMLDTRIRLPVS